MSAQNYQVLVSTLETRLGNFAAPPEFAPLVDKGQLYQQVRVLLSDAPSYYMVEEALGAGGVPIIYVRVILYPGLIRDSLRGAVQQNPNVSLFGSFHRRTHASLLALRVPETGKNCRMLDLVTSGEYEPEVTKPAKPATDELSIMASKVNLLGQPVARR